MELLSLGKLIIFSGLLLIFLGSILILWDKLPFLGKLPGDILIKKNGFTFYFPLVTSILLSILLTIILNLFLRR